MAIRSLKSGSFSRSTQVGNSIILPGDYESIATVTASGSVTYIDFTSIPSTYKHLQIRGIARSGATATAVALLSSINGDNGSNYAWHQLYGDGASAAANAGATQTYVNYGGTVSAASANANVYGAFVLDILDYANTNKYKTFRLLGGLDNNGSGYAQFASGLWQSTSAITQIRLATSGGNLTNLSTFALYGIRG